MQPLTLPIDIQINRHNAAETSIRVEIIRDETAWNALESEWNVLFDSSPTAAPPLRWEWLQTWWRVYGFKYAARGLDSGLRIHLVWRGDTLIGALPLYIRKRSSLLQPRRLCFLSTGEDEAEELCAEHLNLLHLPGKADACMAALLPVLQNAPEGDWDELVLGPLPLTSPLAAWQGEFTGETALFAVAEGGPCFIADISGGLEAYMQRLSKNSRQLARKRLNGATKAGARLEVATDARMAREVMTDVEALHQARWEAQGKPGCFASPRFTQFHAALTESGSEDGYAIVARLVCENETVAAMLGYVAGNKFDSYVAGAKLDEEGLVQSPGIVLHLRLKEYLAERGIELYDHLSGTMRYKQQYTTEELPSLTLTRVRPSLRSRAGRASGLLHRVGSKGLALVRNAESK